jgi:glycosyltransferase involved in cell wall biosynthesis
MKQAVLYICYYNVAEPLVQTQVVAYLRELAARGYRIHLLTFERENLTEEQRRFFQRELSDAGIRWHTLRYHQRPSLPATLYDIAVGTLKSFRICQEHDIRLVHARSYVPAAMALMLKRLTGCQFLFDIRGLLADEYVDAGHWERGGVKYRLTKRMERVFFRKADSFIVLTNNIRDDLVASDDLMRHRADDIEVIPCCADIDKFRTTATEREAYRQRRQWTDRYVLTYAGKFGTWYLAEEMARFFAAARLVIPNLFFQILTQSDGTPMQRALQAAGVSSREYDIRFASPDELPLILGASDAGISFIRACYSKRSSSPTKVGEYLAAGLPVASNAGIGDCDRMLLDNNLGVIVNEFSTADFQRAAMKLLALIRDEDRTHRCSEFARRELSVTGVGGPRYGAVYDRMLRSPIFAHSSQTTEAAAP